MSVFSNVPPDARAAGNGLRPSRRARPVLALAFVAVIALVTAGCSSGAAWIARVDGTAIDSPNFWEGVPLYAELAGGGQAPIPKDDRGISPVSDAANYAMFLVQLHALKVVNGEHGTTVTEGEIGKVRRSLLASPQGSQFRDVPSWFLDQVVTAQANYQALIDYYGKDADLDSQIQAYYQANKDQFRQICMDVIGGTEAELTSARSRITEGTDFAEVAKAVAAAQPPGADGQAARALGEKGDGDVGCVPTSTLANLFADPSGATQLTQAEPNALVGPLPVAGGTFMLFRVRSTKLQSLKEARPTIEQSIGQPGQKQAQDALNKYLRTADIDLSPRIGSWTKGVGYAPPTGAEPAPGATTLPAGLGGAVR